jgi:hypothetical protein
MCRLLPLPRSRHDLSSISKSSILGAGGSRREATRIDSKMFSPWNPFARASCRSGQLWSPSGSLDCWSLLSQEVCQWTRYQKKRPLALSSWEHPVVVLPGYQNPGLAMVCDVLYRSIWIDRIFWLYDVCMCHYSIAYCMYQYVHIESIQREREGGKIDRYSRWIHG